MKQSTVTIVLGLFLTLLVLLVLMVWLRRRNLERFETPIQVTFFRMNGCGWCEKFKPEWKKFVEEAKKKGIVTEEVEASEKPERVNEEGIKGFPTIKIRLPNGNKIEYDGERTSDALMKKVEAIQQVKK